MLEALKWKLPGRGQFWIFQYTLNLATGTFRSDFVWYFLGVGFYSRAAIIQRRKREERDTVIVHIMEFRANEPQREARILCGSHNCFRWHTRKLQKFFLRGISLSPKSFTWFCGKVCRVVRDLRGAWDLQAHDLSLWFLIRWARSVTWTQQDRR